DPERDGFEEGAEAGRGVGQERVQNAVELKERLFVKDDVIQFGGRDATLAQAVLDSVLGIPFVVLLSSKPLLLGGRQDATVADQTGRAVVVIGGNAQDIHGVPVSVAA